MSSGVDKPRRVKSAKARLTPTDTKPSKQDVVKEAKERLASAKAIREKHSGSGKVFPRPDPRASKERFSTMYSKDFDGSFAPAAELRPTSPTRRNNPHPGKVGIDAYKTAYRTYTRSVIAPSPSHLFPSNSWCGGYRTERLERRKGQRAWNYLPSTSPGTAVSQLSCSYLHVLY